MLTADEAEAELRRARNEYSFGDYDAAGARLRSLLYPNKLSTDGQVIEAHKLLALTYYLQDQHEAASDEFAKLLFRDPDYELDAFSVAPSVIDMFESIRKKLKVQLDMIRQKESDKKLSAPQAAGWRRVVNTTITQRSDFATFMPFGVGQFQNGDTTAGVLFATTEALFLAGNIGAHLWARNIATYGYAERGQVQALTVTQYASLAAFGLAWAIGVYHARMNFSPTLVDPPTVFDEPIEPEKPQDEAAAAPAPQVTFAWQF